MKWIKTSDRLPENGHLVLIASTAFGLAVSHDGIWFYNGIVITSPSCWCEIPKLSGEE